jgi:hypothetical protein
VVAEPLPRWQDQWRRSNVIAPYANELHIRTISETGKWGENLLKQLDKYLQDIEAKRPK